MRKHEKNMWLQNLKYITILCRAAFFVALGCQIFKCGPGNYSCPCLQKPDDENRIKASTLCIML